MSSFLECMKSHIFIFLIHCLGYFLAHKCFVNICWVNKELSKGRRMLGLRMLYVASLRHYLWNDTSSICKANLSQWSWKYFMQYLKCLVKITVILVIFFIMENKASSSIYLFLFLAYVKLCLVRFVKATGVEYWNHMLFLYVWGCFSRASALQIECSRCVGRNASI